jgi:hypothetical protein
MKRLVQLWVLPLLFVGCSVAYLTQSRNYSGIKKAYSKIAVIGVSKSQLSRAQFEEDVAGMLLGRGVNAIPSFKSEIDIPMQEKLSTEEAAEINRQLLDAGYDGAIITNLVNASEYTDVIPGNTYVGFYPVRYGRFRRYVAFYPVMAWEPDRLITGTKYILESCLYALDDNDGDNLQWVGMFELKNPRDLNTVTVKYASELTEALLRESILPEN